MSVYFITASLFTLGFGIGIIATMAGVGGAVLFVPIVASIFPFHMDYIRGASLSVALAASLSSAPTMLRKGCASMELVLPMALTSSIFAILGARIGLSVPQETIRILLGVTILFICMVMIVFKKSDETLIVEGDRLSKLLKLEGCFVDDSNNTRVEWRAKRTLHGLVLFGGVGFLAGLFGLGAGWANVPVFNLVLGIPLKAAVACSMLIISVSDTAAVWVYLNKGAILPIVAIPSILGVMLGSRVGVRLFTRAKPAAIRMIVILLLAIAGISNLLKGFGLW